jgi:hypothetical protein
LRLNPRTTSGIITVPRRIMHGSEQHPGGKMAATPPPLTQTSITPKPLFMHGKRAGAIIKKNKR